MGATRNRWLAFVKQAGKNCQRDLFHNPTLVTMPSQRNQLIRSIVLALSCSFVAIGQCTEVKPVIPDQARPLPLSAVRLTDGPLKRAQELDAEYLLKLEPDRMLYYLRERAGLKPKAERGYGGWDGGGRQLTGHICGHYLSAVSLMWAATGDARFKERADYIVSELAEIQNKHGDGYIGGLMGNARPPQRGGSGGHFVHARGAGRHDDHFPAVLLAQSQRFFERVRIRLVQFPAGVLVTHPRLGVVDSDLPFAGDNLFDTNGDKH